MREMLTNKTTYNLLIACFLTASAISMRPSKEMATVFSGLATVSYGAYLLAKNHQVRQQNNRQILLNQHLREHLYTLDNAEDLGIPAQIPVPQEIGITGATVDYGIPVFSALIFALLPLINLALNEKDGLATILYGAFSLIGGACLGLQHYGASNLRRFNGRLEAEHSTMLNLLTA